MSKPKVKRSVLIDGIGKELELAIATKVHLEGVGQFIHLDQLKDGKWRLVWTSGVVDDWSEVLSLKMVRDG